MTLDLNKYLNNQGQSKNTAPSLLKTYLNNNEDRFNKLVEENERKRQQRSLEIKESNEKLWSSIPKSTINQSNEIFGKNSFEEFSRNQDEYMAKYEKEPQSKGWKMWGYIMDTPNRIPGINRAMDSAAKTLVGEENYDKVYTEGKYNKDTGSKVLNKVADLGGSIAGLSMNPGGTLGNSSMLNISDDVAKNLANKATSKMADKVGTRVLNAGLKGVIDGGIGDAINTVRLGGDAKDVAKNTLEGALGGGLMFGGSKAIGEGFNALKGIKTPNVRNANNVLDSTTQIETELPKLDIPTKNISNAKLKNKSLEDAYKEYNNAINEIQNYTGHWKLTDDEILEANDKLEINIFDIVDKIEKLEAESLNLNRVGEVSRLSRVAGVTEPVTNIQPLKSGTELPKLEIPTNNPIKKNNPIVEPTSNSNVKNSRFQDVTLQESELADDVLKGKSKENPTQYESINNQDTLAKVQKEIDLDEKKAINKVLGSNKPTAETMAMGQDLVRRLQAKGDYDTAINIVEKLTKEGTNAGQAIQALSMWKRLTPEGMLKYAQKQINKVNDNLPKGAEKVKLTTDETKKITELMTEANKLSEGREQDILLAQVNKVIGNKLPSSAMDKLDSFRYINMLFNPKTLIKNAGGNVINTAMGNVRDIIATPIDKLVSTKTGKRTVGFPNIIEQGKGLKKGVKETLEDYKLGIDTSKGAVKEGAKSKAFNNVPILGKIEDMLSAGLKLGDEPFYQAAYNNNLSNAMKLNKIAEPTTQMLEDANKAGLEATFQQRTALGDFINKGKNNDNKIISSAVKTVLPFSQTPSAILDTATNYTPLGMVRGARNLSKGMQREGVNQLASGILGTGLIGAGYGLAKDGILTGDLAEDYDTSATQRQAGMQPYALKNGDTYRNIDFAQPAASPLMMGADIANGENSLGGILATGINSIAGNSYLSGLQDIANTLAYKDWGGLPASVIKNYASQLLPFGSFSNAINKTIDPTVKDNTSESDLGKEMNKAVSKIPILSSNLPQATDSTGEPKLYSDKGLGSRALSNFITPWNTTEYNPNSVEKKALDIYNSTGDTIQMPRVAPNTIDLGKGEKYKLTAEDKKIYSEMIGSALKKAPSNAEDMQKAMTSAVKKFKDIIKKK